MLFDAITILMTIFFLILIFLISRVSPIDSDISHTIQSALSKVFDQGKTQINIFVEKEQGKRKSFYLWKKNWYFNSQVCDFLLEEAKLPENTVFYINRGFLS